MKKSFFTILLLLYATFGYGQKSAVKFYNNEWLAKEVSEKKAKFSLTTIENADSSITKEIRDLKDGQIISSTSFKGNEPVGIWKYKRSNRTDELDYSFPMKYVEKNCKDSIAGIRDYFSNNDSLKYIAPVIEGEKSIFQYIMKTVIYPGDAKDNGIMGKVFLGFTINEKGQVENVVVIKGKHILLDKEAVRVIRQLKFVSPPLSNGEAKRLCLVLPISFFLR
jgi:TonB family protein